LSLLLRSPVPASPTAYQYREIIHDAVRQNLGPFGFRSAQDAHTQTLDYVEQFVDTAAAAGDDPKSEAVS
jgi:hypothetical protein